MKLTLQILTLVVLGGILFALVMIYQFMHASFTPDNQPRKWDYKVDDCELKTLDEMNPSGVKTGLDIEFNFISEKEIADYGRDGWELCAAVPKYKLDNGATIIDGELLIFKRPLSVDGPLETHFN